MAPGKIYSISDHVGQIEIKVKDIDGNFLARMVLQAGVDEGFNREYRLSKELMRDLEISLPVKPSGGFDYELMKSYSSYLDKYESKFNEIMMAMSRAEEKDDK